MPNVFQIAKFAVRTMDFVFKTVYVAGITDMTYKKIIIRWAFGPIIILFLHPLF